MKMMKSLLSGARSRALNAAPLALVAFALSGCGILKELRKGDEDCSIEVCYGEGEVGPEGGTIEADGVVLTFPEGALDDYVYITIDTIGHEVAPGIEKRSPVFNFNPTGASFAKSVSVVIEARDPADELAIYWTLPGSFEDFERLPTRREGSNFHAEVSHFSFGFVGLAAETDNDDEDDENEGGDDGVCGEGYERHVEGASGVFTASYFATIAPMIAERYVGKGAFWSGVGGGFPLTAEGELAGALIEAGDRTGFSASFCSADGARSVEINYHPNDGLIMSCFAEVECDFPAAERTALSSAFDIKRAIGAAFTPLTEYEGEYFYGLLTPRVVFPAESLDHATLEWKLVGLTMYEAKIVNAMTHISRDASAEEIEYFGLDFEDDDG